MPEFSHSRRVSLWVRQNSVARGTGATAAVRSGLILGGHVVATRSYLTPPQGDEKRLLAESRFAGHAEGLLDADPHVVVGGGRRPARGGVGRASLAFAHRASPRAGGRGGARHQPLSSPGPQRVDLGRVVRWRGGRRSHAPAGVLHTSAFPSRPGPSGVAGHLAALAAPTSAGRAAGRSQALPAASLRIKSGLPPAQGPAEPRWVATLPVRDRTARQDGTPKPRGSRCSSTSSPTMAKRRPRLRRGRPADQSLLARRRAGPHPRAPLLPPWRPDSASPSSGMNPAAGGDPDLRQRRPPRRTTDEARLATTRASGWPSPDCRPGVHSRGRQRRACLLRSSATRARKCAGRRWPAEGSQFRSRDLFPRGRGRHGGLGQPGHPRRSDRRVRRSPTCRRAGIAYVDGYGNVKTTLERGSVPGQRRGPGPGPDRRHRARGDRGSDGSFAVEPGQLALAHGQQRLVRRERQGDLLDGAVPARRQRVGALRPARDRRAGRGRGRRLIGWQLPRGSRRFGLLSLSGRRVGRALRGDRALIRRTEGDLDAEAVCAGQSRRDDRCRRPRSRGRPAPVPRLARYPAAVEPADRGAATSPNAGRRDGHLRGLDRSRGSAVRASVFSP